MKPMTDLERRDFRRKFVQARSILLAAAEALIEGDRVLAAYRHFPPFPNRVRPVREQLYECYALDAAAQKLGLWRTAPHYLARDALNLFEPRWDDDGYGNIIHGWFGWPQPIPQQERILMMLLAAETLR